MNKNFAKALKKTSRGNYFGYCNGYGIFIFKRPHGGWCCEITRKSELIARDGYHTTYLNTLQRAKNWARFKVVPQCILDES